MLGVSKAGNREGCAKERTAEPKEGERKEREQRPKGVAALREVTRKGTSQRSTPAVR
jgi:hypothetical protein